MNAPRTHYLADVVDRPGRVVLSVEAPFPYEQVVGRPCPVTHDERHVLVRPFEMWLNRATPEVGQVIYSLMTVGDQRIIPFAISIAAHPTTLPSPSLLPGTICVFPGFPGDMLHPMFGQVRLLHATVREATGRRIVVYSHCLRPSGQRERSPTRRKVDSTSADFLHLLSAWYRSPAFIDHAGNAQIEIARDATRAMPQLIGNVQEGRVFVDRLVLGPDPRLRSGFLRSIFLLARRMPDEEEMREIVQFAVDAERTAAKNPAVPLAATAVLGASAIDLSELGIQAEYPLFVHVRGVFAGSVALNVGIAPFVGELPTRRWFAGLDPGVRAEIARRMRRERP